MQSLNWDDLKYFAAVAQHGGLARAGAALGVSAATLSRRVRAFEAVYGQRLFHHGAQGYVLTAAGRALWERTRPMEEAARGIAHWRQAERGPVPVRISAGTWTALDLAENLGHYWSPDLPWLPEFVYCDQRMDLARREIDIGIRNERPAQPWLAGRRTGRVQFAVYAASPDIEGWVGPAQDSVPTPSARWTLAHHADRIVTRANTPQLACALAKAGLGRIVLPIFIAERMPGLVAVSAPIPELETEEWLTAHHEARNEPAIRSALDALASYLRDTRAS